MVGLLLLLQVVTHYHQGSLLILFELYHLAIVDVLCRGRELWDKVKSIIKQV